MDQEQLLIQHRLPKNNFFQLLLFFTESLYHPVLGSLGNSKINRERMKALAIYLPGGIWFLVWSMEVKFHLMKFHWNFTEISSCLKWTMKFHRYGRPIFFMIPLTFNYFSVCGPPICQHYSTCILSFSRLICIENPICHNWRIFRLSWCKNP